MSNARIIYTNLADGAVLTASSWIAAAPPATLQNPHVSRRWKGRDGDTEYILTDDITEDFDTIALLGCAGLFDDVQMSLTAAALTQVRVSSIDPDGLAGDVYDSGAAVGRIRDAYGNLIIHLPSPVSGIVRIDLSEPASTAIMAGRLVVGATEVFIYNYSYGWSYGYADLSRKRKSAGGQTFVDLDARYRVLNLEFEIMHEDDRFDFVDEIDRLNGVSTDILFMLNPASAQLDRDSIWGLIQDMSPPTQPNVSVWSKSYSIEERL